MAVKKSAAKVPAKQAASAPRSQSATAGKAAAKKTAAKKAAAKKASAGKATRKYSPAASEQVGEELHEMHEGKLHIGKSDKLVTKPKQAIAIGLAEARRAGKKVPPNPNDAKK